MQHVYSRGFLVLLPFMMESLGIGTIGAGVMEATRRISSGVASMGGGVITDRIQHLRGPILAGSIGLMGFGYLIIGVFPNYYVILIALGFAAAAGSVWHPPALGILSQRFPERRGYYISLHRSAGNVGETVAPVVFGLLLGIIAWQAVLWGVFPMALCVAILIMIYLRNIGGSKRMMVQGGRPDPVGAIEHHWHAVQAQGVSGAAACGRRPGHSRRRGPALPAHLPAT